MSAVILDSYAILYGAYGEGLLGEQEQVTSDSATTGSQRVFY